MHPVRTHGNSSAMRTASSMLSASMRLNPARTSFASAKGPSTVVVRPPRTRTDRGCRRLEHLRVEQLAFLTQIVGVIETPLHRSVEFTRRHFVEQRGVGVDEKHVFHGELTGVIGNRSPKCGP